MFIALLTKREVESIRNKVCMKDTFISVIFVVDDCFLYTVILMNNLVLVNKRTSRKCNSAIFLTTFNMFLNSNPQ